MSEAQEIPGSGSPEKAARPPQLVMEWPEGRARPIANPPEEYALRCYSETDEAAYIELMDRAGFAGWTHDRIAGMIRRVLPDGFFLLVHLPTGALAATAMAVHSPTDLHPYGGEMGWVAGSPDHSGKGVGMVVCAAVTARLLSAGYRKIYLLTDDFRLPAIKTYLKLGYRPVLFQEGMEERWRKVYAALGWTAPDSGPIRLPGAIPAP